MQSVSTLSADGTDFSLPGGGGGVRYFGNKGLRQLSVAGQIRAADVETTLYICPVAPGGTFIGQQCAVMSYLPGNDPEANLSSVPPPYCGVLRVHWVDHTVNPMTVGAPQTPVSVVPANRYLFLVSYDQGCAGFTLYSRGVTGNLFWAPP